MAEESSLKILFVINPVAGGNKTDWEPLIRQHFEQTDLNIAIHTLTGENDVAPIKRIVEKSKPEKVVAVGGDGTVSLVARMLLQTDIALGILPAGSANGMAKELGISFIPGEAMNTVVNGTIKNADVIKINTDQISLHLSDIGLNARLIKNFDDGKLRGKLGYAKVVLKTLWKKTLMKVHVRIDGQEIIHDAEMVVLANASKYGTGAVINPGGNLFDGHFEVVIMHKLALSELFKMWIRFRPFNPEKMRVFPATSVDIHTNRKVHFQVDGEYMGKVNKVDAEILAGQLKLIVP
ncbi:MAG: diacylglycerol kinase family lipid kinase [Chitinophagaceae bacterium]|nr:diacylglycerol kinase family lipid kinase [Chitinophagaceae bacterium]